MRCTEGGKPLLALGLLVGPDGTSKRTLFEQDESGTESFRVQDVPEGDSGQVSAVSDEARILVVKLGVHFGGTVLVQDRASIGRVWSNGEHTRAEEIHKITPIET